MNQTPLNQFIESLAVKYTTDFVPFSASRNFKEKPRISELSINWKITISKGRESLITDYQEGIGIHFKTAISWNGGVTVSEYDRVKSFAETGNKDRFKQLKKPALSDVLYSLVIDTDVLESSGFEDWAETFGFDTDSRKAESMYRQCLENALKLKAVIGSDNLEHLRELYQDY
jgi:hypothetical protein